MRKYAAEHGWEVGSKLRHTNSDEPPSTITAISATEIRISTPDDFPGRLTGCDRLENWSLDWEYATLADAHAEIKRLRKVMIEQFALYREEASTHRVCHDERDMAQAQVQAVREERDRLANQLVNEIPGSYIQMKERALRAEAQIQAVRAALDTALMGVAENGTRFADFVDKVADACGLLDGERDD